jgi:hypothetical protein
MQRVEQVPPPDVPHLMLVFIGVVTERAVVVHQINGPLFVGVLHASPVTRAR